MRQKASRIVSIAVLIDYSTTVIMSVSTCETPQMAKSNDKLKDSDHS